MKILKAILYLLILCTNFDYAQSWKQFQSNSEHHGRSSSSIQPPYRVRWFWVGEELTLRNANSHSGWTDDLTSRVGYNFPLPSNVDFTISGNVQAVGNDSLVFIGTMEGDAYIIKLFDGTTLKKINLSFPIVSSAAAENNVVVFATLYGDLYGIQIPDGNILWQYRFPKAITVAPIISSNKVICADHSGRVMAFDIQSGSVLWSLDLNYPVQSTPAANSNYLVVCSEDMNVNLVDINTGIKIKSQKVYGQSFRDTHALIYNNMAFVTSIPAPMIGSEYMMEDVMAASGSFNDEESKILEWLNGNGSYNYASTDWKNKYAFTLPELEQPFQIASGPNDGCGSPPPSVVLDNQNRVLGWFKTRYPTLTNPTVGFGSAYGMDIMSINQVDGKRQRFSLGSFAGMWMLETDNLYALSILGNQVWMRQNFRGTQMINLTNANHTYVQAEAQNRDGGNFSGANITYFTTEDYIPHNPQTNWQGRVAPSLIGNYIFIVETYGLVCIERKP